MRLRDESGFTLTEVLVAMAIMLVITAATLGAVTVQERAVASNADLVDAYETARAGADRLAGELRNHATPTAELDGASIDRAEPDDLIFVSVASDTRPAGTANVRNLVRVRYCLEVAARTIWRQTQRWSTAQEATPPSTACPAPTGSAAGQWDDRTPIVADLANAAASQPVWTVAPAGATGTEIRRVTTTLVVDPDLARDPRPRRLSTTVTLRNQNTAPVASFVAQRLGYRHVLLDASDSYDPDGYRLGYTWTVDGVVIPGCRGVVCDYRAPASGRREFGLTVRDTADLVDSAPPESVLVP